MKERDSLAMDPPGNSSAGRAGKVHICQRFAIQRRERADKPYIDGKHKRVHLESLIYD